MSGNLENDRTVTTSKMYPIDLAPQKITIVKSVSNTDVKMTHLLSGQPKTSTPGQIIAHTGPVGVMRPGAQILSPGVTSQAQMIVSGSPILQGAQIVSQGPQIISQSQLIGPNTQILSPGTQIISQGTQLSTQVSNTNNASNNIQVSVPSSVSGAQVLSVGGLVGGTQGQLVSGADNLVVSSSVRTLLPSVRVLPPLPIHNTRPVLTNVNSTGVLVTKTVASHVPRGLAAGASLAVRPVTPTLSQSLNNQGAWASAGRGRSALVYGTRATAPRLPIANTPRAAPPRAPPGQSPTPSLPPAPSNTPPSIPAVSISIPVGPVVVSAPTQPQLSTIVTLPTSTVLTSTGVITGCVRPANAQRPLPLLQRNFQPAKVVGVATVGPRGGVGNSAPPQLYYEVPRPAVPTHPTLPAHTQHPTQPLHSTHTPHTSHTLALTQHHRPYVQTQTAQVSVVSAAPPIEPRPAAVQARPTILKKREPDESPSNSTSLPYRDGSGPGWEDVPHGGASGGSTTVSAASSPAPIDDHDMHDDHDHDMDNEHDHDASPRKKPRKQMLINEIRQCQEYQSEEAPPTPPPVNINPPPKRPQLSSSYVCGWRGTALHFVRPADVRRREPRPKDILAIANQRHVKASADGWKVHHLTAQMEDLVSLEDDVGTQLSNLLRTLETAGGRSLNALQPHSHSLMELLKGNIQRSKKVCEGIQESREDILRVFTHRNFVSEILTRQADKRCFRKHRSQS